MKAAFCEIVHFTHQLVMQQLMHPIRMFVGDDQVKTKQKKRYKYASNKTRPLVREMSH